VQPATPGTTVVPTLHLLRPGIAATEK
jgi:hypothetical protein